MHLINVLFQIFLPWYRYYNSLWLHTNVVSNHKLWLMPFYLFLQWISYIQFELNYVCFYYMDYWSICSTPVSVCTVFHDLILVLGIVWGVWLICLLFWCLVLGIYSLHPFEVFYIPRLFQLFAYNPFRTIFCCSKCLKQFHFWSTSTVWQNVKYFRCLDSRGLGISSFYCLKVTGAASLVLWTYNANMPCLEFSDI